MELSLLNDSHAILLLYDFEPNFVEAKEISFNIYGKKQFSLTVKRENVIEFCWMLKTLIEQNGMIVFTYDLKPLNSLLIHTSRFNDWNDFEWNVGKFFDLYYCERYAGIALDAPESLAEATNRFRSIKWTIEFYNAIHKPLLMKTIPEIENNPVLIKGRGLCYSNYLIEGAEGGRLTCDKPGENFYLPHTLSQAERENVYPVGYNQEFIYFDFREMEVMVLAHISGDDELKKICNGSAYSNIFEMVFGSKCETEEDRSLIKNTFMQVMYGMNPYGISKKLEISMELATQIHNEYHKLFKRSSHFLSQIEMMAQNPIEDITHRRRTYSLPHKARNGVIQGPASGLCMEKLIKLNEIKNAKTVMSIHDGFLLSCHGREVDDVTIKASEIMSSASEVLKDLKLNFSIKRGKNFGELV